MIYSLLILYLSQFILILYLSICKYF